MSEGYIAQAIEYYTGRTNLEACKDYTLQNDGNGAYIKEWKVEGITQPTIEQLIGIASQLANAYEFQKIKELAIEEQIKAQSKPMFFLDKYYLDCSDGTTDLLIKAKLMLEGTSTTEVEIIDYQGIPTTMTLDDINLILGDKDHAVVGVLSARRKDLHTQMIQILKKVLLGQEYEIKYI
jgi:hypothetical protein